MDRNILVFKVHNLGFTPYSKMLVLTVRLADQSLMQKLAEKDRRDHVYEKERDSAQGVKSPLKWDKRNFKKKLFLTGSLENS